MENEKKRQEASMHYSIIDGSLWFVMFQAGISFLTPFALVINAPLSIISALNAFPPLLDGISQKIGSYFPDYRIERKKNHHIWSYSTSVYVVFTRSSCPSFPATRSAVC